MPSVKRKNTSQTTGNIKKLLKNKENKGNSGFYLHVLVKCTIKAGIFI